MQAQYDKTFVETHVTLYNERCMTGLLAAAAESRQTDQTGQCDDESTGSFGP